MHNYMFWKRHRDSVYGESTFKTSTNICIFNLDMRKYYTLHTLPTPSYICKSTKHIWSPSSREGSTCQELLLWIHYTKSILKSLQSLCSWQMSLAVKKRKKKTNGVPPRLPGLFHKNDCGGEIICSLQWDGGIFSSSFCSQFRYGP